MEILLVDDAADLPEGLAAVAAPVVGVDVERLDGERYFRGAALVQIGVEGRCAVVDPLAVPDLTALGDFLAGRLAILHAVENDVEPLESSGAALDGGVADTAVAAALLGLPTGLAPLLVEVLDVELSADKERFQRADWGVRPVPQDMLEYAAGDVVHLPALWVELARRLDAAGRRAWHDQEVTNNLRRAREQERSWRRTRGIGHLDGRGRAVLREVWAERERIARDADLAPQLVLRDEALVEIAADPPLSSGALAARGLRPEQVRRHGHRLLAAVRRGMTGPEEAAPSGLRRSDDRDRGAHDRLRRARAEVARDLGIDPGFLCPSRVLWDAVLADPADPDELCTAAGFRPWQCEVLADPLWEAYTAGR